MVIFHVKIETRKKKKTREEKNRRRRWTIDHDSIRDSQRVKINILRDSESRSSLSRNGSDAFPSFHLVSSDVFTFKQRSSKTVIRRINNKTTNAQF